MVVKMLQDVLECHSGNMIIIPHGDDTEVILHQNNVLLAEFLGFLLKWTSQWMTVSENYRMDNHSYLLVNFWYWLIYDEVLKKI